MVYLDDQQNPDAFITRVVASGTLSVYMVDEVLLFVAIFLFSLVYKIISNFNKYISLILMRSSEFMFISVQSLETAVSLSAEHDEEKEPYK